MQDENQFSHFPQQPNNQPVNSRPLSPIPPKKAPKKKLLFIILGIILTLLVAAAIFFILWFVKPFGGSDTSNNLTLSSLSDSLKSSLGSSDSISVTQKQVSDSIEVIYEVSDNAWVGVDDGATILTVSSSRDNADANKGDYDKVITYLDSVGFEEVKVENSSTVQYFFHEDAVCNIDNTPEYILTVSCAQKDAFQKNSAAIGPLTSVYKSDTDALFGEVDVQNSATENYKTARVDITELGSDSISLGEFYQTPDSSWYLFVVTQEPNAIDCEDYNTEDLKNAYAGFSCFDTATNTTSFVSKDAPTFEVVPGSAAEGSEN